MRLLAVLIPAVVVLSACTQSGSMSSASRSSAMVDALATVTDASGRELGTLTVAQSSGGLVTRGTLRGLTPGMHGIHLHTTGRCEAPFTTAGGHWNPAARQHGFDNPMGAHAGDMPNLMVGTDGSATVDLSTRDGMLRGANALMDADGAAIVVHAMADDNRTDPSGNSGDRIACGVIRAQ